MTGKSGHFIGDETWANIHNELLYSTITITIFGRLQLTMRSMRLKLLIILSLLLCLSRSYSQQDTITRYFDSSWNPIAKESACYYTHFVSKGSLYEGYTYWVKSNTLFTKTTYRDTFLLNEIGTKIRYYENGVMQDSIYPSIVDSSITEWYHFYKSGKIFVYRRHDPNEMKTKEQVFDEQGNRIEGYIYLREPAFKRGQGGWERYIRSYAENNYPEIVSKQKIKTSVTVALTIAKEDGTIKDVSVKQSSGYAEIDAHAIAMIKNSPSWIPAIIENKPADYKTSIKLLYQSRGFWTAFWSWRTYN